jgi:hypothetical protein
MRTTHSGTHSAMRCSASESSTRGAARAARSDCAELTILFSPSFLFPLLSPNVEFCGYTMPHPSDPKFHLRLQTKGGARAVDVLQEGLESLATMCDELEEVFSEAVPEPER